MILIPTYPCTHEITPGYDYLPIDTPIKKKPVSIPVTYPPMGISSWVCNPDNKLLWLTTVYQHIMAKKNKKATADAVVVEEEAEEVLGKYVIGFYVFVRFCFFRYLSLN